MATLFLALSSPIIIANTEIDELVRLEVLKINSAQERLNVEAAKAKREAVEAKEIERKQKIYWAKLEKESKEKKQRIEREKEVAKIEALAKEKEVKSLISELKAAKETVLEPVVVEVKNSMAPKEVEEAKAEVKKVALTKKEVPLEQKNKFNSVILHLEPSY